MKKVKETYAILEQLHSTEDGYSDTYNIFNNAHLENELIDILADNGYLEDLDNGTSYNTAKYNDIVQKMYESAGYREREIMKDAIYVDAVDTPDSMFVLRFDTGDTSAEYLFYEDNGNPRWVG